MIGEQGHAGIALVDGAVYAAIDADEAEVRRLWTVVLQRSPLYQTLTRSVRVAIELRLT